MMGGFAIGGLVGGILAILAGIVVIVKPKILAWVIGIYLIIMGVFFILGALAIT